MSQRRRDDPPNAAAALPALPAPVRARRVTLAYGVGPGSSELPAPIPTDTPVPGLPAIPRFQVTRDVENPPTVQRETRRAVAQTIGAVPMTIEASIADVVKDHLAALSGERRDELRAALGRGEFVRAISMLDEERQRYPKNVSLARATQLIRDYATERLTKRLGGLEATPMLFKPTLAVSTEAQTILKLANGVSTIDDVIHASPLSRLRTSEILVDLLDRGALALRNASEVRRPSTPNHAARELSPSVAPQRTITPSKTPAPVELGERFDAQEPRTGTNSRRSGTRTKAPADPSDADEPDFDLTTRRTDATQTDIVEVDRIAVRGKMSSSPPKPPTIESSRAPLAPRSSPRPESEPRPTLRDKWIFPLVAVSAVASVAALVLVLARPKSEPAEAPIANAGAKVVAADEAKPVEPVTPKTMMLSIDVTPENARIFIDDVLLSGRPLEQALPRDARSHQLRIEAPAHKPRQITFVADRDAHFVVSLEKAAALPQAPVAAPDTNPLDL